MNASLAGRLRLHAIVSDIDTGREAVREGATVVQLRVKGATTAEVVARGRDFRTLAAMFVINDDVDAALALGADGVHLGDEDPGAHRAIAAGLLVGMSASEPDSAAACARAGAAYLGCGPVWSTPSKSDAGAPIGVDGLARLCAAVDVPVVAIGGVDEGNAGLCIAAGAAGVAVIRALHATRRLRDAVDRALADRTGQAGAAAQLRRTS